MSDALLDQLMYAYDYEAIAARDEFERRAEEAIADGDFDQRLVMQIEVFWPPEVRKVPA